jgi:hypothetical protein
MVLLSPPSVDAEVQRQHAAIAADPGSIDRPLKRLLLDCPHIDADDLLSGLVDFHAERMKRCPPATVFPEIQPWVEHLVLVDRELQTLAGLTDRQLAQLRSLGDYLTFRGYGSARPAQSEKCRVAWIPDTDEGPMHIKNVDDPMPPDWPPAEAAVAKKQPASSPEPRLIWDGVGSGLHVDDEPDQIFPLPIPELCRGSFRYVPEAVEFLTHYCDFWGGQNCVLHDSNGAAVAIEKTSRNFIECYSPNAAGRVCVSGMVTRDANSAHGRHVAAMRRQYMDRYGLGEDGADYVFWQACDRAHEMLARFLERPGPLRVDAVLKLFLTPWPDGLNKEGAKLHPQQGHAEFTLITCASLPEARRGIVYRRCGKTLKMPATPHITTW